MTFGFSAPLPSFLLLLPSSTLVRPSAAGARVSPGKREKHQPSRLARAASLSLSLQQEEGKRKVSRGGDRTQTQLGKRFFLDVGRRDPRDALSLSLLSLGLSCKEGVREGGSGACGARVERRKEEGSLSFPLIVFCSSANKGGGGGEKCSWDIKRRRKKTMLQWRKRRRISLGSRMRKGVEK